MFDFVSTAPTSEVAAVNIILSQIGEPPITDLTLVDVNQDVQTALRDLRVETRNVQTWGYTFNTDKKFTLRRDTQSNIQLPTNTIKCVVLRDEQEQSDIDAVVRNQRLYDRTNNTFVWSKDIICELTRVLPFEWLPEAARMYITIKAARKWQKRQNGNDRFLNFTADEEQQAMVSMAEYELDTKPYNFVNENPTVFRTVYGNRI